MMAVNSGIILQPLKPTAIYHRQSKYNITVMEFQLVVIGLLLSAMCNLSKAAPAHHINQRQVELADGPDDVRWRLVSGLETIYLYAEKLVSV